MHLSWIRCVQLDSGGDTWSVFLFFFGLFWIPGITNYEEYSLIQDTVEEKKEDGMGTLKKDRTLLRDERKMEKLKAKLHTDDDCESDEIWSGGVAVGGLPWCCSC